MWWVGVTLSQQDVPLDCLRNCIHLCVTRFQPRSSAGFRLTQSTPKNTVLFTSAARSPPLCAGQLTTARCAAEPLCCSQCQRSN